jgi:hypothetical protein
VTGTEQSTTATRGEQAQAQIAKALFSSQKISKILHIHRYIESLDAYIEY